MALLKNALSTGIFIGAIGVGILMTGMYIAFSRTPEAAPQTAETDTTILKTNETSADPFNNADLQRELQELDNLRSDVK
ncbi:MAG: hypothetical protein HYS43_01400 [Candidatus Liptonbacteria bacterium]|nr:hypothetical protein [Candidatus Liptonbacteria bacterium]